MAGQAFRMNASARACEASDSVAVRRIRASACASFPGIIMVNETLIEEFHLSLYASPGILTKAEIDRAVRHVRTASFRGKLKRLVRDLVRRTSVLKKFRAEVSW
jgi:hypothetical protein